MSVFETDFIAVAAPDLFRQFGVSVIYRDPEMEDVTLTALVGEETSEETTEEEGVRSLSRTRIVSVGGDPGAPTGGVAAPSSRATVEIDGFLWSVRSWPKSQSGIWDLHVRRVEPVEVARREYRAGS